MEVVSALGSAIGVVSSFKPLQKVRPAARTAAFDCLLDVSTHQRDTPIYVQLRHRAARVAASSGRRIHTELTWSKRPDNHQPLLCLRPDRGREFWHGGREFW